MCCSIGVRAFRLGVDACTADTLFLVLTLFSRSETSPSRSLSTLSPIPACLSQPRASAASSKRGCPLKVETTALLLLLLLLRQHFVAACRICWRWAIASLLLISIGMHAPRPVVIAGRFVR